MTGGNWTKMVQTLKDKIRADCAGWSLAQLADLTNRVSLSRAGQSPEEGTAGTALESVYAERYTAHVAGWSCDRLTAHARETTDDAGTFLSRSARAENDACTAATDARHPEVEPLDTFDTSTEGTPGATSYSEHARRVIMAAAPCENHGAL